MHPRAIAIALIPVVLSAPTVHWPNGWYLGATNGGLKYIAVLVAALLVHAGLGEGSFALVRASSPWAAR